MSCNCLKPVCGISKSAVSFHCENDGRDVEFTDLADFLPRVTLVAKGVPDDVALEYLRQAAHTLARDSGLLKREVRLDVQAGVRDYYLELGDNEQVHYVDAVQLGSPVTTVCRRQPLNGFACRDVVFEPKDKIILTKTPKADKESHLFVRYFAMPTQAACAVDSLLFDHYHDVVVNGALANLLLMRQYEFADPPLAAWYEQKFKQGIAGAKIDVLQQFETTPQTINLWGKI